jgi:hypothetical protein
LADGVRLAASLHLPDTGDPCPALPYRRDDVTAGYRQEYRQLAASDDRYTDDVHYVGGSAEQRVDRPFNAAHDPSMRRRPMLATVAALLAAALAAGATGLRLAAVGPAAVGDAPSATVTGRAGGRRLAATLPAP